MLSIMFKYFSNYLLDLATGWQYIIEDIVSYKQILKYETMLII